MYSLSETHLHSVVIWIFQLKIQGFGKKKRAHALFFKCRGSTCAFSISLPILGANSCLDYFSAISEVILHRLVLALRVACQFAFQLFNLFGHFYTFAIVPWFPLVCISSQSTKGELQIRHIIIGYIPK